jgi:hypothetical protein
MQEAHFLGLLLVRQEIDGLALVAELALGVDNLGIDIRQITNLLCNFSLFSYDELAVFCYTFGRDYHIRAC